MVLVFILISCSNSSCPEDINYFVDSPVEIQITRVIDGDTYEFIAHGEAIKIRVINFDAFETRNTNRLKEQAELAGITVDSALVLGEHQKKCAEYYLLNNNCTISRSEDNFDSFGRLLRHVMVGKDSIQALLHPANLKNSCD